MEELQVEYTRLFIGPRNPSVLLYASCHLLPKRNVMSEETLAVREACAKSGHVVERLNSLPDDHLGIELEFLFALTRGAADAAGLMRLFAERGLGIAVLSHALARDAVNAGRLVQVLQG